ncbi:hypothetical protein LT493_26420 [Streptomyces tricolor]|nr:hypothetical protein [Streptomyces tricolor]
MLGVEDAQVDERGELRGVARCGELQQLPGGLRPRRPHIPLAFSLVVLRLCAR